MSKYYYLIAGLPELMLEDTKLSYTVADFKTELYPTLSDKDKKIIDLFYLQFDNANVLLLLKDREATIDARGLYEREELLGFIEQIKEGDEVPTHMFPSYLSTFISDYFHQTDNPQILWEDRLSCLYFEYAMKSRNSFVSSWFSFNLTMKNVMVALTARKYKMEVSSLIVGNTDVCETLRTSNARDFGLQGEVDEMEQFIKISEIVDLVEREKKMDQLRWKWMEDASFFHYFTIERLFVFLLQIEMIERWISLDKEKGSELFRNLIDQLKEEVEIPAEFK